MTHTIHATTDASLQQPIPMLRWVFQRQASAITCEVDCTANHQYEVCVVPHWDVSRSAIERFDSAPHALQRHAELAMSLREEGWIVVDHGVGNGGCAAA
jgi:hypothetical protein